MVLNPNRGLLGIFHLSHTLFSGHIHLFAHIISLAHSLFRLNYWIGGRKYLFWRHEWLGFKGYISGRVPGGSLSYLILGMDQTHWSCGSSEAGLETEGSVSGAPLESRTVRSGQVSLNLGSPNPVVNPIFFCGGYSDCLTGDPG
jgi:hypothetical protein